MYVLFAMIGPEEARYKHFAKFAEVHLSEAPEHEEIRTIIITC